MWVVALSAKLLPAATPPVVLAGLLESALIGNDLLTFIVPLIVLLITGVFTLRSNVAKIWKENYEAKVEENKILTTERDEQREKKHEALTELAATKNQLALEQGKTDLSAVVAKLDELRDVQKEILAALTSRP